MANIYPPDILIKTLKKQSPYMIKVIDTELANGVEPKELVEFIRQCEGSEIVIDACVAYIGQRAKEMKDEQ